MLIRSLTSTCVVFFLLIRRPPISTRTDTLFPYPTLFRSLASLQHSDIIPAIAPIGIGPQGETYNINADTVAGAIAAASGAARLLLLTDVIGVLRSEEHTSELQSLMRISYAVFCLKKKK